MKKIYAFLASIILILLLSTGIFANFFNFMIWLVKVENSAPNISVFGAIIVRVLTFLISYSLVGIIFKSLDWFNSKLMSIIYFVISTLIFFVLAYVVWLVEEHILIIGIIFGGVMLMIVASIAFIFFLRKKTEIKND